jgi:glucose/arabinose dehydrogenase
MHRARAIILVPAALLAGCGSASEHAAQRSAGVVATGLQVPWGIAFLPGGDALVAERPTGRIYRVGGGRKRLVMTVPGVADLGEGGLLGLAVSPNYGRDRLVYAYMTTRSDNRIVRFRLGGRVRAILTGIANASNHNGGRIAFGPDGRLYAGVGDAGDPDRSQRRGSLNGKILRLDPDGSPAAGNPFGTRVWSLGHRNVQGLAWDRAGRLWATEFGQNRLDEVNLIRPGRNYGWPLVEGRGDTQGGRLTNPKLTWSTDEASPSGAAIRGRFLYVAALRGEALWRVRLDGSRVTGRTRLLYRRYGRLRRATETTASCGFADLDTAALSGTTDVRT